MTTYKNVAFYLFLSMVLDLLDQLQFYLLMYFIELVGFLTNLGLLRLLHLVYRRILTRFGILVFFTYSSFMRFQVRYLVLISLFSVIDGLEWFWMGRLHKNIQLLLELLKAPFLVLHFYYYTLMTFYMALTGY